ncbi:MAG: hypothetical protein FWF49_00710 [Oscillospiraceae bacterium]|nr:hypothetical protein [Oscillospiraceae bacterium]
MFYPLRGKAGAGGAGLMRRAAAWRRAPRRTLASLLCALCLLCGGCGFDVAANLRPPRGAGDQQLIAKALESYLKSQPDVPAGAEYTLKYPLNGSQRAAFIVDDYNGDGQQEAYAFYRVGTDITAKTRVNYLAQINGTWQSVADIEGFGYEIDRVFIAHTGSGTDTLCVGWQQAGTYNCEMLTYEMKDTLTTGDMGGYSAAAALDLLGTGYDQMLLFNAAHETGGDMAYARLYAWTADGAQQRAEAPLDPRTQYYTEPKTSRLSSTVTGVYADGVRTDGSAVTELVYWNGQGLIAPFSTADNGYDNVTTWRKSGLPSMDIDGDGAIEWPLSSPMSGYTDTWWVSKWQALDFRSGLPMDKYTGVVNLGDGYCLRTADAYWDTHTVSYDAEAHELTVVNADGAAVLKIDAQPLSAEAKEGYDTVATAGTMRYSAWYGPAGTAGPTGTEIFSLDKLRYMLMLLPAQ